MHVQALRQGNTTIINQRSKVEIVETRKVGNEVVVLELPSWEEMVSKEHTWLPFTLEFQPPTFGSRGLGWLEVNQSAERNNLSLEVIAVPFAPSVVSDLEAFTIDLIFILDIFR